MKKNLIIVLAAILASCGNSTKETVNPPAEEIVQETTEHENPHLEPIELNNGEKWKVDSNMLVFIHNMEKDIMEFKGSTIADHKVLSEKIKENIGLLTSNCTMEGKAHDELHKWLVPFIDLTTAYSEADNADESGSLYKELKKSFTTFNNFFN